MKPNSILGKYLTKQLILNFIGVLLVILGIIFLFEMQDLSYSFIFVLHYEIDDIQAFGLILLVFL